MSADSARALAPPTVDPPVAERSRRTALLCGGGYAGAFLVAWGIVHLHHYTHLQVVDTPGYLNDATAILHGRMPYRSFPVEYPPLALPVFVFPALFVHGLPAYTRLFGWVMAICGAASGGLVGYCLVRRGAELGRLMIAALLSALTPLLLGSVILSRYDAWPALLTLAAVVALSGTRPRIGFALLGLGLAAKGYPLALLPLALIHVGRVRSRREAMVGLGVFAAVVVVTMLPFVLVAPHGVWSSLSGQGSRLLQIESLGAATLLVAHQLFGLTFAVVTSDSANIIGGGAAAVAIVLSALQILAVLGVTIRFWRRPPTPERFLCAAAAVVCAFIVFDRVLSPQYLIWLVPLVAILPGPPSLVAGPLLANAMVLTQLWFPDRYFALLALQAFPSWLVVARDVVLLVLFATLARGRGTSVPRAARPVLMA